MKVNQRALMKRAWGIRENASIKLNVKISLISMRECLKMAWAEIKANKEPYLCLKVRDKIELIAGTATVKSITKFANNRYEVTVEYDNYKNQNTKSSYETFNMLSDVFGGHFVDRNYKNYKNSNLFSTDRFTWIVDAIKAEETKKETTKDYYIKKIKEMTTDMRLDKYLDEATEKVVKTVYVMLEQGGNLWIKEDKVRIYLNNAYKYTSLEKLNVYKPDLWLTKQVRGDYANWKINGVETDTIYTHAKAEKEMCARIERKNIELNLYYDVKDNSFNWLYYYNKSFKIEETVVEKINEMVKSL